MTPNCVDFCDKASLAIPCVKSAQDDHQDLALYVPALVVVPADPLGLPVQWRGPRRAGPSALPIRIAFVRLAL